MELFLVREVLPYHSRSPLMLSFSANGAFFAIVYARKPVSRRDRFFRAPTEPLPTKARVTERLNMLDYGFVGLELEEGLGLRDS
jgi:hypothetical protein